MAKQSKREQKFSAVDREKFYGVDEAIATLREYASKKFDETVEVAMNLGVDPRHADQMVRGVVSLPKGTGKTVRVAVFAKGAKADEATKGIPIIATTAFAMRGDEEMILASGCDAYMSKPIAISQFLELIETFMLQVPDISEFAPE